MTSQVRKLRWWRNPALDLVLALVGLLLVLAALTHGPVTSRLLFLLLLGAAVGAVEVLPWWLWARWAGLDRAAVNLFELVWLGEGSREQSRRSAQDRAVLLCVLGLLPTVTAIVGGWAVDDNLPGRLGWAVWGGFLLSYCLCFYPQYRRLWRRAGELIDEANRKVPLPTEVGSR